jgi:hypothetical protein
MGYPKESAEGRTTWIPKPERGAHGRVDVLYRLLLWLKRVERVDARSDGETSS